MANSVYTINKGINRPIEFKGLKAQYIWYLGGGLVGLLVLFTVLYITGLPTLFCLGVVVVGGVILFLWVYRLSDKYGAYGLMKKMAHRGVPTAIRCRNRRLLSTKQ